MKKSLLPLLCAWSLTGMVHAAPQPQQQEDNLDVLLQTRHIVSQIQQAGQQVSQSVRSGASDLVATAMGFLGVPYRYGGTSVETGFDCSGFVRATFEKTVGKVLPRRAVDQAAATAVIPKDDLQPGDLVFFKTMRRTFSHVGIYIGNGQFIHAPRTGSSVRIENMDMRYWQARFSGARRVVASDESADPLREFLAQRTAALLGNAPPQADTLATAPAAQQ